MIEYAFRMERRLQQLRMTARTLGVPAYWLRAEALAGRVPALKAGRKLLFDHEAVEEALLARAGGEKAAESNRNAVTGEENP